MSILIFRSGQLLSLVTAGASEGGLSGGCQGAILSSRRLNVKKEISAIISLSKTLDITCLIRYLTKEDCIKGGIYNERGDKVRTIGNIRSLLSNWTSTLRARN